MADPRGKIVWVDSTGTTHSFTFEYPATSQPYTSKKAIRHDNIAESGAKEAIFQRIDRFAKLTMDAVIAGTDIENWDTFTDFALAGGSFQFYPDYTASAFTNYTLEDTDWEPQYVAPGWYKFQVTFRQVAA